MQIVDIGHAANPSAFGILRHARSRLNGNKASGEQHRSKYQCDFFGHARLQHEFQSTARRGPEPSRRRKHAILDHAAGNHS